MLNECEEVCMLTSSTWDSHNPAYASNEDNMTDWRGDMREVEYRQQIIIGGVAEDENISSAVYIGNVETQAIEDFLKDIPNN